LRKAGAAAMGKRMGWHYVHSTEPVAKPNPSDWCDATLNCSGYGSLVSVTATFGLCAAGWVMSQIAQANLKKP
jgi:tRNA A37 threonylcarbamoyladenosine dehydratase